MKVSVIGAGKMGLPIACQLASRGADVYACDVNPELVATINRGECPFEEPGIAGLIEQCVKARTLTATTDIVHAIADSEVVIVIVPVLLTPDRHADLRHIETVARQIGKAMKPGTMVVFETTLPVGSTRSLLPLLESGGLRAGKDFDLVFSPERVKSLFVLKHLTETPKIIGGHTPAAAARASAFYGKYLSAPIIDVGSPEAAELVKLAGMVYRDVNIALANELARYAEDVGVDFEAVAAAANTDGEAALLTPGIGVGGHCTPVYPYFLIHDAAARGTTARITELSRQINDVQAAGTIDRLIDAWEPLAGRRVMILGLGFRPEVKEHTCSPAFLVRDALVDRKASVELCDPLYTDDEIRANGFEPGHLGESPAPEVLILVTAHKHFLDLDFGALAQAGLKAVIDGRNAWDPASVRQSGLVYLGIGRKGASSAEAIVSQ